MNSEFYGIFNLCITHTRKTTLPSDNVTLFLFQFTVSFIHIWVFLKYRYVLQFYIQQRISTLGGTYLVLSLKASLTLGRTHFSQNIFLK